MPPPAPQEQAFPLCGGQVLVAADSADSTHTHPSCSCAIDTSAVSESDEDLEGTASAELLPLDPEGQWETQAIADGDARRPLVRTDAASARDPHDRQVGGTQSLWTRAVTERSQTGVALNLVRTALDEDVEELVLGPSVASIVPGGPQGVVLADTVDSDEIEDVPWARSVTDSIADAAVNATSLWRQQQQPGQAAPTQPGTAVQEQQVGMPQRMPDLLRRRGRFARGTPADARETYKRWQSAQFGGGWQHLQQRAQALRSLSRLHVLTESREEHCAICLETFKVGERVRTLLCMHQLHASCAWRYFKTLGMKLACPVCRLEISFALSGPQA